MLKIGAYLKTQRERKGLSYEQIHETTRISPDVLRKIEAGQFLAAPVFLKGFVKNYARALGLDPAPLLQELEQRIKSVQDAGQAQLQDPPEKEPFYRFQKKQLYIFAGFGLVLLPAFLVLMIHISNRESGPLHEQAPLHEQTRLENEKTELKIVKPETADRSSSKEPPPPAAAAPALPATSLLNVIQQEAFTQEVMINPAQSLEVYFKTDGGDMTAKSLLPKKWYVIKALEKIYLRIDKPSPFYMIHNGQWRELTAPLERTFE